MTLNSGLEVTISFKLVPVESLGAVCSPSIVTMAVFSTVYEIIIIIIIIKYINVVQGWEEAAIAEIFSIKV